MTAKFHHALVKSLATAGLVAVASADEATVSIVMEGVTITTGPIADVKDLAAEAKKIVAEDDFDLDAFVEAQGEAGDEAEAEDEGDSPLARTMRKYRNRYKEIGANDSNGDAVALAMRAAITRLGDKKGDAAMDLATLEKIADANNVPMPTYDTANPNNGRIRMTLGNVLRGILRRGTDLVIGDTTIPATDEAKAKKAAAFEKAQAKAEAKATPKQTKEEKAAKAKARREASKAKANEGKAAEAAQIAA